MKIGVDFHGFMESYPEVLKPLLEFMLSQCDHEIYVLSGPEKEIIIEDLTRLGYIQGVHYDEIFSIVDFLKKKKDPNLHQDEKGNWWTTDENWFSSKGQFCIEEGIEVIFDDKIEYEKYLPPWVEFYRIERRKK